ncbi:MAG: TonB-dependent receptor, partial [Bacteroidota bacterium]
STRIKFVGGARFETTDISLSTAELANGTAITSSIEEADLLPAATMIYKLTKKMNLRASYTRTLARPSFRELAP